MAGQASVGFFGKLPCNGDFLQRRVPLAFLEVWDPWLQESWLSTYLTSPLWRFVLPDSVCGSGAYAGVLAPSVDRVGRYFPLTLVMQIDVDICPLDFAARRTPWFEALESLIVAALEESNVDLEWFDAQVAALAPHLDEERQESAGRSFQLFEHSGFPEQGSAWRAPLNMAGGLQSAINAFAYRELARQLRPVSIWWSDGSAATASSWLCLRSLPAPEQFSAMLSGQWTAYGWNDLGELGGLAGRPAGPPPPNEMPDPPPDQIAQARALRVTLPDAQLTAIDTNRAAFVVRAEIGLWATVATVGAAAGGEPEDVTAVRMIADALQQLAPASSLTGLVESVRQTLTEVHRELGRLATRDVMRVESQANFVALLAAGAECALLSAGPVQKLRVRARMLEPIDAARAQDDASAAQDSGSLMELLTGSPSGPQGIGASGFRDLRVHYERLQREDHWILCARPILGPRDLEQLAATAASGMPISVQVIIETVMRTASAGVVPMMALEI